MPTDSTAAAQGYRWPAEWEAHAATWVAWPHNQETWPGKFDVIPPLFTELIRTLAEFETVHVLAGGEHVLAQANSLVGRIDNVKLFNIPTNDAWCRDYGPTFLSALSQVPPALVDWRYNAWGGKYPPYDQDNDVPQHIAATIGHDRFIADCVLEGGAIDGNGQGSVLTTRSCLLNPNRNPERTPGQIERLLHDHLGARKVIWLPRGELAGDDTDGHVDQLARFVSATTVVVALSEHSDDVNREPLRENYEFLRRASDQEGNSLQVVPLPQPAPKRFRGQPLPTSYCNFYLANGAVLVPQFEDPADQKAVRILSELFPEREVRGLPALDLVWGLGAWHCVTLQQPA